MTPIIVVTDPNLPFAKMVNDNAAMRQIDSNFQKEYTSAKMATARNPDGGYGDPEIGRQILGTELLWEDASPAQQDVCRFYIGQPQPDTVTAQKYLDAASGPDAWWNRSFSGWGFIMGKPHSPALKFATIMLSMIDGGAVAVSGVDVSGA